MSNIKYGNRMRWLWLIAALVLLSILLAIPASANAICLWCWDILTVDSAGDTGWHNSLAFDAGGNPAISYKDSTNDDLKLAYDRNGDGDFADSDEILTVDSAGDVGSSTSLAFDAAGYPAISYFDSTNGDLKLAYDRNGDGDFTDSLEILTLESAGYGGLNNSLAFDVAGNLAISYRTTGGDLKLTYDRNGDGYFTSDEIITVDSSDDVGHFNSLAFDAAGNPAISYYDWANEDLKLAYDRDGNGDFTSDEILTIDSAELVRSSLAFNAAGNPAISYSDSTNDNLKLAYDRNGDGDFADADEMLTVDSTGHVGYCHSLAFDASGNPAISYFDFYNHDLKLAYDRNGDGDFFDSDEILTVDSSGAVGRHNSLAFDATGNPAISYLDYTNQDLKLMRGSNCSGDLEIDTVDSDGDVGSNTSLAFDDADNPAISYLDITNEDLKLAYDRDGNGDFTSDEIITIDSAELAYSSLAFDANGNPAISYSASTNYNLKLAYDRNGDGDFTSDEIITVDSMGYDTSLAFDTNGYPAISYFDESSWALKLAYDRNGDGDFTSDEIITVDSDWWGGDSTSLAFDTNGHPAISYHDLYNDYLKLAYDRNGDGDFTSDEIITVDSSGDVGNFNSLAFDNSGNLVISYYEGQPYWNLKLAYDRNGDGDFTDPGEILNVDGDGIVGWFNSLAFDNSGNLAISYYDWTNGDLKLAYDRNGDGDFADVNDIYTMDSTGSVGRDTSLAFDTAGNLAISYFDDTHEDLKLACYALVPEVWVDDDWADTPCNDDPDGAGPATAFGYDAFDKIQDGIDSVAFTGTVHVADGTYHENITMKSNVKIMGSGMSNCTINGGDNGPVVIADSVNSSARLEGFTITNGLSDQGGGIMTNNSSLTVTNCMFTDNLATIRGGGICNDHSSLTMIDCTFTGNSAPYGGGIASVGTYDAYAETILTSCIFRYNWAYDSGGAIYNSHSIPNITNCVFTGNGAGGPIIGHGGGAIFNGSTDETVITNCTFSKNSAHEGGAVLQLCDDIILVNSILWGNSTPTAGTESGPQIAIENNTTLNISYCDVEGGQADIFTEEGCTVVWGSGNIDQPPMFVDAYNGDLHLQGRSPCIDAGNNAVLPADIFDLDNDGILSEPIPFDFEGDARRIDDPTPDTGNGTSLIVDMGADEVITEEVRVTSSSDDAEEFDTGWMYLTSSDLELTYDSDDDTTQTVGIRFSGIDIPQNATITNAYIQFQVDEASSQAASLTIEGHDIDNAPTFTSTNSNISSRTRTSASISWYPEVWNTVGADGPDQRTSNISAIVQEIVSRPGWSSGNSMAIIITGLGNRVAEAYDGDPSGAPLLHVEYTTDEFIPNTPIGPTVVVSTENATITFDNVTGSGSTTVTENETGPAIPQGFEIACDPPVYYDVVTTASYTDEITVCFSYDECDGSDLHLFHYHDGQCDEVPYSIDDDFICGTVSSLSEFILAIPTVSTECIDIPLKSVWNMVSVPVIPADNSVASVFPGVEVVYSWNPVTKSYYIPTEIEPYKGYWVAVLSDTVITVCGSPVNSWTDDMTAVWNMIGSVSGSVDFTSPDDNPDGSVEPFAYQWDPVGMSYVLVTTLDPTKGHWIAATQECTLTLTGP